MAVVRQWTKGGALVSDNTSVPPEITISGIMTGRIAYMGSGQFLVNDRGGDTLRQFEIAGHRAGVKVKDHFGYTASASNQGWGIAMAGNPNELERGRNSEAGQIVTLEVDTNLGINYSFIRFYDLESAALNWGFPFQAIFSLGGIIHDGHQVIFSYENAAALNLLARVECQGTSWRNTGLWLFTPLLEDLCYDGEYVWGVQGSSVLQIEVRRKANPQTLSSFALSGGTCLGIATDGNHLYTMHRS